MTKPKPIAIDLIRIDAGTQFRAAINQDRVTDYAELFDGSKEWPFDSACEVYFDGLEYYLVDGFHRYHAASRVKRSSLSCIVHSGTQRDAIKYALSANARHGLHRSNEDKRKAVAFVLADSEWSKLSSRAIAEICGVGHVFVGNMRSESTVHGEQLEEKRTGKDGRTRSQPKPKADPKPEPTQAEPEAAKEPDVWEDVDDEPEPQSKPEQAETPQAKPEPSAKERASGLKSIIKQHNAAMMRAVDDLQGVMPNQLGHDMAHKSFRRIHELVEAWR
mgnify:CR=1 FL=1|tara:strand:- start:588 stop:1412 length:825 start_codon:yes stop_codon:yes gene_type:complete